MIGDKIRRYIEINFSEIFTSKTSMGEALQELDQLLEYKEKCERLEEELE